MLALPDHIELPDPRRLVPGMVTVHRRHPRLNLLNLEAAAAAHLLAAHVALSPAAADRVLPAILDEEAIGWVTIEAT